ncbi:MAG: hypothetical protein B6U72_00160 [Candidatus Altiarchaeales archaeon ex4484_2]|nr:MAG: hypothetical protein B6U72_00160 [Candidatus Altiarchaeales archaeon ex4484_2]
MSFLIHDIVVTSGDYAGEGKAEICFGFEVAVLTNLESKMYWKDMGCNTLYVTRVVIACP